MATYNETLRQRVLQLLDSGEITQAAFAKKIGYTPAAVSQYKNGKYEAKSTDNIEQAIAEFFEREQAREEIKNAALAYGRRDNYIPISTSEMAYKQMRLAQLKRELTVIYGDTGVGKTKAAYCFVDDHPTNTVYVMSAPSSRSLRSTLKMIARELRLPICQTADLAVNIKEKLQREEKTLIIDEAQNLTVSVVDEISRWVDPDQATGEGRMAIVLIGNDGILEKFNGDKDRRRDQNNGRLYKPLELRTNFTTMDDIRKLFPALADQEMKKELEFLLAVARGVTGVRAAVKIYNSAVDAGKIDYDTLYSFAARKQAIAI